MSRSRFEIEKDLSKLMWEYYEATVGSRSDYEEEWIPPYLEANSSGVKWHSSDQYHESMYFWLIGDGLEKAGY